MQNQLRGAAFATIIVVIGVGSEFASYAGNVVRSPDHRINLKSGNKPTELWEELHDAVVANQIGALEAILKDNRRISYPKLLVELNKKYDLEDPLLHIAVDRQHREITRLLLLHNAFPNTAKNDCGESPLACAAKKDDPVIMGLLLAAGAKDEKALAYAIMAVNAQGVKLLLDADEDFDPSKTDTPEYEDAMNMLHNPPDKDREQLERIRDLLYTYGNGEQQKEQN